MKLKPVAITFGMQEILEVEAICTDDDAQSALRFLKSHVLARIENAARASCDPDIETRRQAERGRSHE